MEFKGTKGDWKLRHEYVKGKEYPQWMVITGGGHKVCEIDTDRNPFHQEDAKLISAAPELLEALKTLKRGMELLMISNPDHKGIVRDISTANKAIEKALK